MEQQTFKKKVSAYHVIMKIFTYLVVAVMIIYCISLIFPLVWLILNSFKDRIGYAQTSYFSLPEVWHFENYKNIFVNLVYPVNTETGVLYYDIWNMTFYSFYYAILTSIYSTVTLTITAYAVGRYKDFWLSKLLFAIGLVYMVIPFVSDGGASLLLKKRLGIYDNLLAWVLTSGGCIFTGQWFFVMVSYFRNLGKEYADAAYIDGAGQGTVFVRIMIPLAVPIMSLVFFLSFISAWNNYGVFLYYLPSYANLALGMYTFQFDASISGVSTPEILAGFVIVSIPAVILYLLCHNLIINNLNIGGLKG